MENQTEERIYNVNHDLELQMANSITSCPECAGVFYIRKGVVVETARKAETDAEPTIPPAAMTESECELLDEMLQAGLGLSILERFRRFFAVFRNNDAYGSKPYEPYSLSNTFGCPYCNTAIQLEMQIAVMGCKKSPSASEAKFIRSEAAVAKLNALDRLSPEDRKLYDEWNECGLLELFLEAIKTGNPGSVPQKPDRQVNVVRIWFRTASFLTVPRRALARFVADLDTSEITFYQSQGVVGVVADGYLRTFLSKSAVMGYGEERLSLNGQGAQLTETWRKTKYGYAAGRGIFFQALQLESNAAIGSATGKQRGTQSPHGTKDKA